VGGWSKAKEKEVGMQHLIHAGVEGEGLRPS